MRRCEKELSKQVDEFIGLGSWHSRLCAVLVGRGEEKLSKVSLRNHL